MCFCADSAFDRCQHSIMLSQLYHVGVHVNQFDCFKQMHSNTHIEWNGLMTNKTRQDGKSAAEEYKNYNN